MREVMQFSKKTLLREVDKGLTELNYKLTPVLTGSFASLHFKKVEEFVLTLALEFSKYYEDRFTASFYLSYSFELPFYPPGLLRELAYRRVGEFLTLEERRKLLDQEFCREGVVDAWWIKFTQESIFSFLETTQLCEARFLGQKKLFNAIRECSELHAMRELLGEIKNTASYLKTLPSGLMYQPKKYVREVSTEWYWAAEIVMKNKGGYMAADRVTRLAVDAWRVATLLES